LPVRLRSDRSSARSPSRCTNAATAARSRPTARRGRSRRDLRPTGAAGRPGLTEAPRRTAGKCQCVTGATAEDGLRQTAGPRASLADGAAPTAQEPTAAVPNISVRRWMS
jgi:hypothetical protein